MEYNAYVQQFGEISESKETNLDRAERHDF